MEKKISTAHKGHAASIAVGPQTRLMRAAERRRRMRASPGREGRWGDEGRGVYVRLDLEKKKLRNECITAATRSAVESVGRRDSELISLAQ